MTGHDSTMAAKMAGAPGNVLLMRFIGRLLGLISHELNNHLAVLGESIGLADDILNAKNMSEKQKLNDLIGIVRSLNEKLNKPTAVVRHLSDFSLQFEQVAAYPDGDAIIDRLLSLMQRMSFQNKIVIRKSFAGHSVRLSIDPLLLQFLFFALLDNLYAALETGGNVTINTSHKEKNYCIRITSEQTPCTMPDTGPWPQNALFDIVNQAGGTLKYEERGGTIILKFPVAASH